MPQQKALERMNELIRSLQQAMGRLGEGKLGLPDLEQTTEDARAIYERLVVLRHKAREAAVGAGKSVSVNGPPVAPSVVADPTVEVEVTESPIRLNTRPLETPPHQTSLIDAIAETETGVPKRVTVAPKVVAPPKAKPDPKTTKADPPPAVAKQERPITVADKMEHAPVADLRKAIALSQKFWFVAELFGGERDRYEKSIDAINGMGSKEEAETFMRSEIIGKLPKPPGEEVTATFMDLLQRRFS